MLIPPATQFSARQLDRIDLPAGPGAARLMGHDLQLSRQTLQRQFQFMRCNWLCRSPRQRDWLTAITICHHSVDAQSTTAGLVGVHLSQQEQTLDDQRARLRLRNDVSLPIVRTMTSNANPDGHTRLATK